MECEYTVQNLEYALSVFYNGEAEERAKAHCWLTHAQRVPEAWKFVWDLLQPNKGTEIQFYAATTLHTKILRCWNELLPKSREELKKKLVDAVIAYSNGPKIVTNRLCISLAAFILQQGSQDLLDILCPFSTVEDSLLLLDILTVIPEEFHSMTMESHLRAQNRTALHQASKMVLDKLLTCLQSVYNDYSKEPPSDQVVHMWMTAATCVASWFTHSNYSTTLTERAPLCRALQTAVHVLYTYGDVECNGVLEACEACLGAVRVAGTAEGSERYEAAALQLLTELADLAAPLLAPDDPRPSPNEELLSALVTCCVAVSECHSRVLMRAVEGEEGGEAGRAGARRLLQLLLAAQAAPGHYPIHETRSNLVFSFWYMLQDEIIHISEKAKTINPIWLEVFTQLLLALIKKSEMAPESALTRDDQELLRCYRQDIADTVMYCFNILGDVCWSVVEGALAAADAESSGGAAAREAALHVLAALADAAPSARAPPALVAALSRALAAAAPQHAGTLHTALDCLGAYASWLSSLEEGAGADMARECVRAAGVALPHCPAPAALALRRLCADCSASAADLVADIVHVAQVGAGSCDAWTRRQLLIAAGAALAASEPQRAALLLGDLARALQTELIAQAGAGQGSGAGAAEAAAALMCALAPQPALSVALFRVLWPALASMPTRRHQVEPMFHILKHTVSSLMGDCMFIINDIAELAVAGINTHPCAVGIDVIKLTVLMVGDEWGGAAALLRAAAVAGKSSDELDALFTLLLTVTKKKPHFLDWIDDLMPELVDLACVCVHAWEVHCACAASGWLATLAAARPLALRPRAPELLQSLLRCIGGMAPSTALEPLTELLLALNKHAGGADGMAGWLNVALAPPAFPTQHASQRHKHKFIVSVLREKNNKRRLLETVQEFSLACRGLIDTEYARQTIAAKQLVA